MGDGGEHVRIQLWPVHPVHFSTLVSMVWLALLHDKNSCAGKFPSFNCLLNHSRPFSYKAFYGERAWRINNRSLLISATLPFTLYVYGLNWTQVTADVLARSLSAIGSIGFTIVDHTLDFSADISYVSPSLCSYQLWVDRIADWNGVFLSLGE